VSCGLVSEKDLTLFLFDFHLLQLHFLVSIVGAEISEGKYNSTYFNQLSKITDDASKYGIYTLLNLHQEILSEKYCGEGFPDYVINKATSTVQGKKTFPFPIDEPYHEKAEDGYPTRYDCSLHELSSYYHTHETNTVFQNLYRNASQPGSILGDWSRIWEKVASLSDGNSAVLGYELLHKPWPGNVFSKAAYLMKPSLADMENLQTAYDYIVNNIRKVDSSSLIFFSSSMSNEEVPSSSGFIHPPSGFEAAKSSVFSFSYKPTFGKKRSDGLTSFFDLKEKDAKRLQTGSMLVDFDSDDTVRGRGRKLSILLKNEGKEDEDINNALIMKKEDQFDTIASTADKYLLSYIMTDYKSFCRETPSTLYSKSQTADYGSCKGIIGSSNGPQSLLWNNQGEINSIVAQKLARTYAQKVAGKAISMKFNSETKDFEFIYLIDPSIQEPTEIFLSKKYQYQNGYDITLFPKNKVISKPLSENVIGIYPLSSSSSSLKKDDRITIRISCKKAVSESH
jgi:endoglycosylceramidase